MCSSKWRCGEMLSVIDLDQRDGDIDLDRAAFVLNLGLGIHWELFRDIMSR